MSNTVRVLYDSPLPGTGRTTAGQNVQRKQEVRGRIVVDSYVKGGESLTPSDLGLTNVDYLNLEVLDPIKSPGKAPRFATWVEDTNQFYVYDRASDGSNPDTQVVEVAGATAVTIMFVAFGDSVLAPVLS